MSSNRYSFVNGAGDAVSLMNDWLASGTGRLGYSWGPGMIYAKGGGACRDNGGLSANAGTVALVDRNDTGYTVGAGLEYMFAPAWSAKIEYQYYNFDRTNVAITGVGGPSAVHYRDD